jgi:acetolactate synthase-1/3 small subunit
VVHTTEKWVQNIVGQIENRLKSLRLLSYWWRNDLLENAIFKIDSALLFDEKQIQNIIKESNSEIVTVSRDFCDFKVRNVQTSMTYITS